MTASLYQSALSGSAGAVSGRVSAFLGSRNTEYMRRQGLRVELDEIAPAAPLVVAGGDQIFQRIGTGRRAIEIDVPGLLVARVEIHGDENQVLALLLRIADELVAVRRVEAQRPVGLQCFVLLP